MTAAMENNIEDSKPAWDAWVVVRVEKHEIFHLRYTMEAYEGLCVTTTLPGGQGLVRLNTSHSLIPDLMTVLEALKKEMELEIIEAGEDTP